MEITISLVRQVLVVHGAGREFHYPVSTSRHGAGEQVGSYRTPRGRHVIRAKIGTGLPAGSVLRGRRPTGEVCTPAFMARDPGHDWITSRILWLSGLERGRNRGGAVDTMRRYVYIHGTPHAVGVPGSIGCVRMGDADVIELFDLVPVGTPVLLSED